MDPQPRSRVQSRRRDGPPRKLCKGIKRVRTGCQTCKKRRKKCDEARPYCQNCVRANLRCPGLPVARIWEETLPGMRAARCRSRAAARPVEQCSWTNLSCSPLSNNESLHLSCQSLQALQLGPTQYLPDGFSTMEESATVDVSLSYGITPANRDRTQSSESDGHSYALLPYEPPPLVPENRSELRELLLCHFLQDMSRVLTVTSTEMVEVIKPYAELDETVMSALLCLSASHILNTGTQENQRTSIRLERDYLHREVVDAHQRRLNALRVQQLSLGEETLPFAMLESVFLSCLLLCIYEICEGNVDDASMHYLSSAREVLLMSSQTMDHPSFYNQRIIRGTAVNPYFVELFVYHEALAAVTSSSALSTNSRFYSTVRLSYHGPFIVDLQDGFSDFTFRISALRFQARTHRDIGTLLQEAKEIEKDLCDWDRIASISNEGTIIERLYKKALYTWLFVIWSSLISHDTSQIAIIEDMVKTTIIDISQIGHNDPVLTSLLFPLFIIGGAANDPEDRTVVRKQFQKLKRWTCFGNVDRALSVVEEMWRNHDSGSLDSWDWVLQLQTHNMSLLVT